MADAPQATKIFVCTVGKVASASIRAFFEARDFQREGRLGPGNAALYAAPVNSIVHLHNIDRFVEASARCLAAGHRVVVITGSRDLMSRHISAFFQNINVVDNRYWYVPPERQELDYLLADFERRAALHHRAVAGDWLSRFARASALDSSCFRQCCQQLRAQGWSSMHDANRLFLFYRLENLDASWPSLASLATGESLPNSVLPRVNTTSGKEVAVLAQQFLESYRPSPGLLDLVYASDLATLCYSHEEISVQKHRWLTR